MLAFKSTSVSFSLRLLFDNVEYIQQEREHTVHDLDPLGKSAGVNLAAERADFAVIRFVGRGFSRCRNHFTLFDRPAADGANLIAGVAVISSSGFSCAHKFGRVIAGRRDDFALGQPIDRSEARYYLILPYLYPKCTKKPLLPW